MKPTSYTSARADVRPPLAARVFGIVVFGALAAAPARAIVVEVARNTAWPGGFTGQVDLRNDGAAPIGAWELRLHSAVELTATWNALPENAHVAAGASATFTNETWNGTIAPGATVSVALGFQGNGELDAGSFDACRFNGAACQFTFVDHAPGGDGAAPIALAGVDGTARRLVLDAAGNGAYALSAPAEPGATFTASSNNPGVVAASVDASRVLHLHALAPGRAGVLIASGSGQAKRRIGVVVKQADGRAPGLPAHLALGSVSEDTTSDLDFWWDFGAGRRNRRVDVRYIYLNGGPGALGWANWGSGSGSRARTFIRESQRLGVIPLFVFYNVPDGSESYPLDLQHLQDASYIQAYFANLKLALDIANAESPDEPVGFLFEPDLIGYMAQNSGLRPAQLTAATNGAYAAGVLQHGLDPEFPNTLTGFVQAVNYTVSKRAPQAWFGWQMNLWASPPGGFTTPIPGAGLMHLTDAEGIATGRAHLRAEAAAMTQYYLEAGIGSYGADFVSVDKYGYDAVGQNAAGATDPAQAIWFWHSDHWGNYLEFARTMHGTSNLPVVLWQLPVGHINHSLATNPYAQDGVFPDLANTSMHYEDSAPDFFFGDTFLAAGARRTWFAHNASATPGLVVATDRITWPNRMADTRDAGVVMALFGAGVGDSTHGTGSPPGDAYWWIVRAQDYYAAPVPLANADRIFVNGFEG